MWMGYWPEEAIYVPWVVWAVSWILAAVWANRTVKRPGGPSQLPYYVLEIGGFAVLLSVFIDTGKPHITNSPVLDFLYRTFWHFPVNVNWALVGLATFGFLFCWWARLHLGRLWSGWITKKEGHRIIDTGPYALVRHPIYTGVLTAALATMLLKGSGHAIVGFAMLVVGYFLKAKLEERFLRQELGAADYNAYAKRVPMLVPFVSV